MCFGNRHLWRLGRNVGMERLIMNKMAFPSVVDDGNSISWDRGMTLRDYFAAKAMQTYMHQEVWNPDTYKDAAEKSYRVADAMLKARES